MYKNRWHTASHHIENIQYNGAKNNRKKENISKHIDIFGLAYNIWANVYVGAGVGVQNGMYGAKRGRKGFNINKNLEFSMSVRPCI